MTDTPFTHSFPAGWIEETPHGPRLTARAYEEYSGVPTRMLSLDQITGWNVVSRRPQHPSENDKLRFFRHYAGALLRRHRAIIAELGWTRGSEARITQKNFGHLLRTGDAKDLFQITVTNGPGVLPFTDPTVINAPQYYLAHDTAQQAPHYAPTLSTDWPDTSQYRVANRFIVSRLINQEPCDVISASINIDRDLLKTVHIPPSIHLMYDLHELVHTRQLCLRSHDRYTATQYEFASEIDADRGAFIVLEKYIPNSAETTTAYKHMRYLDILRSAERYMTAPFLDDALPLRGIDEPSLAVLCSVSAIRGALAVFLTGIPFSDRTEDQYLDWMQNRYDPKRPEELYQPLRQLVDADVFDTPLTRYIAEKICAAAEYFVPGVTGTSPTRATAARPAKAPSRRGSKATPTLP